MSGFMLYPLLRCASDPNDMGAMFVRLQPVILYAMQRIQTRNLFNEGLFIKFSESFPTSTPITTRLCSSVLSLQLDAIQIHKSELKTYFILIFILLAVDGSMGGSAIHNTGALHNGLICINAE